MAARANNSAERPSQAIEDYLKAIYALGERGGQVTSTMLGHELGVRPSSVSAMLGRLRDLDLVSHRPYSTVSLSPSGVDLALRVIRRRRLIEAFLVETLDYAWHEVEHEAEVLSRAASDSLIERISERLGHPVVDPHGDPIPDVEGHIQASRAEVLSTLEVGATGRLARVWNGDPEVLRYLDGCGIELGDRIEVLRREPYGGLIVIRVGEPKDGRIQAFGNGLAEMLSVEPDP